MSSMRSYSAWANASWRRSTSPSSRAILAIRRRGTALPDVASSAPSSRAACARCAASVHSRYRSLALDMDESMGRSCGACCQRRSSACVKRGLRSQRVERCCVMAGSRAQRAAACLAVRPAASCGTVPQAWAMRDALSMPGWAAAATGVGRGLRATLERPVQRRRRNPGAVGPPTVARCCVRLRAVTNPCPFPAGRV